jgi:hypothetical protein
MKRIGMFVLVLMVFAGCASDPARKGPPDAQTDAQAPKRCPSGYYKMCEEKQGEEFCGCVRPMPSPPNTGIQH